MTVWYHVKVNQFWIRLSHCHWWLARGQKWQEGGHQDSSVLFSSPSHAALTIDPSCRSLLLTSTAQGIESKGEATAATWYTFVGPLPLTLSFCKHRSHVLSYSCCVVNIPKYRCAYFHVLYHAESNAEGNRKAAERWWEKIVVCALYQSCSVCCVYVYAATSVCNLPSTPR